jgi:hypothetical protein
LLLLLLLLCACGLSSLARSTRPVPAVLSFTTRFKTKVVRNTHCSSPLLFLSSPLLFVTIIAVILPLQKAKSPEAAAATSPTLAPAAKAAPTTAAAAKSPPVTAAAANGSATAAASADDVSFHFLFHFPCIFMRTCAATAAWHICSLHHDSLSPVPLFVVQKKAAREAKFGTGDKVTARAARFGIPVKGTAAGACSICLHIPSAVNSVFQVFFFCFCFLLACVRSVARMRLA